MLVEQPTTEYGKRPRGPLEEDREDRGNLQSVR